MKPILYFLFPPKKEKSKTCKIAYRPISDMESDGVYFSEEIKNELEKKREKLLCHYSDLPSVWSYND